MGLQPIPFDHSGTDPDAFAVKHTAYIRRKIKRRKAPSVNLCLLYLPRADIARKLWIGHPIGRGKFRLFYHLGFSAAVLQAASAKRSVAYCGRM